MTKKNNTYRYPRTKAFESDQEKIFFGRDNSLSDFQSFVNIKDTVILFGTSGVGKSSFINARYIPYAESVDKKIFKTDFQNHSSEFKLNESETNQLASPLEKVKSLIKSNINAEARPENDDIREEFLNMIPNENSWWYWLKLFQSDFVTFKEESISTVKKDPEIVFIFDQFERLFSWPTKAIDQFSIQLANLLYGDLPTKYNDLLSLDAKLARDAKVARNQYSNELKNFLYYKPRVKFIFIIREDSMYLFWRIKKQHPDILKNLFELKPLSDSEAADAIKEPALIDSEMYVTGKFSYSQAAVEKIINEVKEASRRNNTDLIEKEKYGFNAAYLQIICSHIEKKIAREGIEIDLPQLANIKNYVKDFYTEETDAIAKLTQTNANDIRNKIGDNFISGSTAIPIANGKLITILDNEIIEGLANSSIIKKESFGNTYLYELGHDSLIGILEKEKKEREIEKKKKENERKELENQAKELENEQKELENERKRKRNGIVALFLIGVGILISYQWNENSKMKKDNKALSDSLYIVVDSNKKQVEYIHNQKKILQSQFEKNELLLENIKEQRKNQFKSYLDFANNLTTAELHDFPKALKILGALKPNEDNKEIWKEFEPKIKARIRYFQRMIPIERDFVIAESLLKKEDWACAKKMYEKVIVRQLELKQEYKYMPVFKPEEMIARIEIIIVERKSIYSKDLRNAEIQSQFTNDSTMIIAYQQLLINLEICRHE